jgi:hypothetical protein
LRLKPERSIWFISTYDSEVTGFGGERNIRVWEGKYTIAKLKHEIENWFSFCVMFLGLAVFDTRNGNRGMECRRADPRHS